jgi:hypothetical protein
MTLVAICTLLTSAAIDGNAASPQPSVSNSMQKSGGGWFYNWHLYGYPAYPGTCVGYASRSDQIVVSEEEVDENGNTVNWIFNSYPGEFWNGDAGNSTFYDSVYGYGWYSYCFVVTTYTGTTSNGTFHIWTDLATDGFGYYWVFPEEVFSTR